MRLTPDEAVAMAIRSNLSLETARLDLDTLKRRSDLVWNQFLPDVSLSGSLSRDNEVRSTTMGPITIPGGPQWHVLGNFSVTLNLSAALFAGISAIRQEYQTGLVTFEKAKTELERDIRTAYNQMLLLQENIRLLKDSFETSARLVDLARQNYLGGLVPELTWLQARVNMENMRPQIDQAENGFKAAMSGFAIYLGLPYDTRFELIPFDGNLNFVFLDTADLISRAASGNLGIYELQQRILYLQNSRSAEALRTRTPILSLSWNYNPVFTKDPWNDSWGNRDFWQRGGSFSIALGWSLNGLFPFTKEGQGIKNLDNSIKSASIGLTQMIQATETAIYNTVLSLEQIRTSAEAQRLTVELAEQSYRLTEEAYAGGLQDQAEVQNAELALYRARVQMLEQQFNYLNKLIELEYAAGIPFGTLSTPREGSGETRGGNNEQ
jgi:outer membrane protein TolC